MRVLIVSPHLEIPGNRGGSVHQLELAKALAKNNEVHMVCARGKGEVSDIKFHYVPKLNSELLTPLVTFLSFIKCLFITLFNRIDVIHDRGYLFGFSGTFAGFILGCRRVLQVDDNWIPAYKRSHGQRYIMNSRIIETIVRFVNKLAFSLTNRILPVSESLAKSIQKDYNISKSTVVRNGVDVTKFDPRKYDRKKLRAQMKLKGKVIVFVGEVAPWQGVDVLIDAMAGLDARLLVVGGHFSDDYRRQFFSDLKARAKKLEKQVVFIGRVPHDDVPKYLAVADICVAPFSEDRGFGFSPLKLFEYMAAEKPIVTTSLPFITEIVSEKQAAIVKPNNAKELHKGIKGLLDSEKKRKSLARAAKKLSEQHSWQGVAKKLMTIYVSI
jgi:glycosyltransferase involved in cell wall biosynthesis